jgi:hypothetical protein
MTIRRGEEWGESVARPDGIRELSTDAALADHVASGSIEPVAVVGGDVHRSLGAPPPRATVQRVPMDLLAVTLDESEVVAVAHVVARRSWWRGRIVAVMNVDHLGEWNVAPRAHPNDGRFDVVEVGAQMSTRQRIQARGRLRQGTHVPHPRITTATATARAWEFDRATPVWIDGVCRGSCRRLAVTIRPDAYRIHV